jgi:hypothetical protein
MDEYMVQVLIDNVVVYETKIKASSAFEAEHQIKTRCFVTAEEIQTKEFENE